MGWTNRGKKQVLNIFRDQGASLPATMYVALTLNANAPTVNTNTFTELDEIAAGNGYTAGGIQVGLNTTDFDTITQDDANTKAFVQMRDLSWTASGGTIPSSGDGARYCVITDNNATPANREVWFFQTLTSDRTISNGQQLTLEDLEISISEPA